jgi:hypothetical protein
MKIETIYFLERVNKGNYEHIEMSATAKVEDGEDPIAAMLNLKHLINSALTGKVNQAIVKEETPVAVVEEVKEDKPKQTRTRKAKEEVKVEEVKTEVVEEVKETPKAKKSKLTSYGADNKAVLQAYLTSKYAESWKSSKPRNEILEFTSKLPGMDFLDEEGNIVPSFLEHIHGFFG